MSDQRIPISQLSETQTAPDASYIAIDDGSLTKKITVENFNSTSTASAQSYANQAAASAQTVEDNIATSAAQIREATLAAREATQASTAATASATSAYDSASLAQNYSVNAATSAGQAMNAADTVAQGVTESKEYAEDSEAWAVGKRNGTDVPSSDDTYHNNAKYYSDNATTAATSAASDADRAEAAAESINVPDTTLTVSGVAAESKATGDRISSVNAELADIRVKANGKTASTAGDAVREQVSELKNDLDDLDETVNGVETRNYVEGKNLTSNSALQHAIIDDPNACISDHIPVTWGSNKFGFIYTDDADDTNGYQVWCFDSSNNFLDYYGRTPGMAHRQNLVCPENTTYIIISFKRGFTGVVTDNNLNPVYYTATAEITAPGLEQKIGDLSNLETEDKTSVVSAINEVRSCVPEFPITPKDTSFFYVSKNLADPATTVSGEYVNQGNGNFVAKASYNRTDYIPVSGGNTCLIKSANGGNPQIRYAFYTSQKVYISGAIISGASYYLIDVPDNAAYIALSTASYYFPFMVAMSEVDIPFEEYGIAYILSQYIQTDISDAILNLPSKIYATTGIELNIYFDSLTENWKKYSWNVDCAKGKQVERGYQITPTDADAGTYPITITISPKDNLSISKSVTADLVITSASAGGGTTKSVIVLGDSTTYNGYAVEKLHTNFENDVMTIVTNGTMGTAPNNHEGRSGWSLNDYFTKASITYPAGDPRGTIYNPFYNPSTETFDATYYFNNSGVPVPDWFIINMGINDMFNFTTDKGLSAQITKCIDYLNAMINSIHSVSAVIKIGICVTIPPNHSQDAFGKAYGCGQTRDRYKHNNTLWANAVIDEFTGRESDGVYLVPIHTNLDTIYNMGMETIPVNSRNTETYQSPIGNGGVHPSIPGYWQVADVYTAFLKAQA